MQNITKVKSGTKDRPNARRKRLMKSPSESKFRIQIAIHLVLQTTNNNISIKQTAIEVKISHIYLHGFDPWQGTNFSKSFVAPK